jgi:hypothetical protein
MVAGADAVAAGEWVIVRDLNIDDLLTWQTSTNGLLSYFGITNATLIDGSKIYTGGVMLDTLLSGLSEVGSSPFSYSITHGAGNYYTFPLADVRRIRELRTHSASYNYYTWPGTADYINYKIAISVDNTNWQYIRGTAGVWEKLYREQFVDQGGVTRETPMVFILDGSDARYIRLYFDDFYTAANAALHTDLSGHQHIYGALAWIDGGHIHAKSITVGGLDQAIQDTIQNFDNRNDQDGSTPVQPAFIRATADSTLNSDGTVSITLGWDY